MHQDADHNPEGTTTEGVAIGGTLTEVTAEAGTGDMEIDVVMIEDVMIEGEDSHGAKGN